MKRLLTLFLAAMMLLSLCACGEKQEDTDAPLEGPSHSTADTREAQEAALYRKYERVIDLLENGSFNSAVNEIIRLADAAAPKEPKTPIADYFTGEWYIDYTSSKLDPPKTITLAEKSVTFDGTKYQLLERHASDTQISYWLLQDGVHKYGLALNKNKEDLVPYVSLYTAKVDGESVSTSDQLGTYYNQAHLGQIMDDWYNLDPRDKQSGHISRLYLGRQYASVQDTKYSWALTEHKDNKLTAKIGEDYTFVMEVRGDRYVGTLTDKAGNSQSYYSNCYDYDRTWPEFVYPRALQYLEACKTDLSNSSEPRFTSYLEEQGQTYRGNDAWKALYEIFAGLKGYKDSADYLARFTILEGMHTSVTHTTVNNMGNVSTDKDHNEFRYNVKGQMTMGASNPLFEQYGIDTGDLYFFYNDAGQVERVQKGSGNNISVIVTPVYDDLGRMVSGNYKSNSYTHELSYTYDDQGRLASNLVWESNGSYYDEYFYTYDDQGRLIQQTRWQGWSDARRYRTVTDFSYDDQGHLIREVSTSQNYNAWNDSFGDPSVQTVTFTNDAQGRHLSATIEGNSSYTSQTLEYLYTDLYFFDDLGAYPTVK